MGDSIHFQATVFGDGDRDAAKANTLLRLAAAPAGVDHATITLNDSAGIPIRTIWFDRGEASAFLLGQVFAREVRPMPSLK